MAKEWTKTKKTLFFCYATICNRCCCCDCYCCYCYSYCWYSYRIDVLCFKRNVHAFFSFCCCCCCYCDSYVFAMLCRFFCWTDGWLVGWSVWLLVVLLEFYTYTTYLQTHICIQYTYIVYYFFYSIRLIKFIYCCVCARGCMLSMATCLTLHWAMPVASLEL